MKRFKSMWMFVLAGLFVQNIATAQKIETRKSNPTRITRLETAMNHLSVIELGEEITEVAVGSNSYRVEWRENKVYVQPVEANSRTNLFIWTKGGRLSYELVPATVERMHFAIDEEPERKPETPAEPAITDPQPDNAGVPTGMLLGSQPVGRAGAPAKAARVVEVALTDLYRTGGKLYLRYTLRNRSGEFYQVGAPAVYSLAGVRSSQSLIPVRDSQLIGDLAARLSAEAEVAVPVVRTDLSARDLPPGASATGVVSFEEPPSNPGSKSVFKLEFPRQASTPVVAYLVL